MPYITNLVKSERDALKEAVNKLKLKWPLGNFLLFGSKVRGTADEESDLDLLIILPCPVTEEIRRKIIHMIFDINLKFESNISVLIMSEDEWNNSPIALLPIHAVIEAEGIPL